MSKCQSLTYDRAECLQIPLILQCEDSLEGILTAIYEGFVYKKRIPSFQTGDISIRIGEGQNMVLFATEIEVQTDLDKAYKTLSAIQKQISFTAYNRTISALCHFSPDRGDAVLGFLIHGFSKGSRVTEDYANPYVMRVVELARKTDNESHNFCGFIRFHDVGRFLYGEVEPKCDILPLVKEHFDDRYPNEHYVLYDKKRKYALIHKAYGESIFVRGEDWNVNMEGFRDGFEELWKGYFEHIAIEARKNPRCQNNLLPKWYRKNMLEF